MRRVGVVLFVLALTAASAIAQRVATFEKVDVTDTPVGLATATINPPGQLQITTCQGRVETAQIRGLDLRAGTVSATTGRIYDIGDVVDIAGAGAAINLRWAKTGSTSAIVSVECWQ